MVRTLVSLILAATFTAASAQDIQATEAMEAKAKERTELVARTVGSLSESQQTQVQDVYMEMEKYATALELRFQGQPKEQREADMPGQLEQMDRFVQEKLATILTKEQLALWTEASK